MQTIVSILYLGEFRQVRVDHHANGSASFAAVGEFTDAELTAIVADEGADLIDGFNAVIL